MTESSLGIDRIDQRILSALQADGRLSNLKLAEAVALSPTAVLARVQRLTREGYILGYEARLNPLKLGRGMMVFVEVLLDRTTPNVFEQFRAAVQAQGKVLIEGEAPRLAGWPASLDAAGCVQRFREETHRLAAGLRAWPDAFELACAQSSRWRDATA